MSNSFVARCLKAQLAEAIDELIAAIRLNRPIGAEQLETILQQIKEAAEDK